eukprot:jgi/Mesvir1/764/Mv17365-RA.1
MNVPNILHKHLKDDVLNCNRMRRYLLDQIAAWWRRQSAYDLVTGVEVDGAPKSRGQFFADLTAADARLLGHPSKCPEGSGNIYFEYDPSEKHRHGGKMPKQVEPYTKDDAGNLVQNPNAQFVMCAPLKGASPYAQGTGTLPNLSWEDTAGPVGVHYMGSRRGKTPLTAEELAVVQSGDVSPLTRWSAAALPADGWVSCILCDGLMPSQKVELTLRVPTGFAFYHADCFDSSVHRRLDTRLPCRDREASEEEGDKDEDEVIPSQVQWDLDKPDGGEY